jgi:hypothetical protein
MGLPHYVHNNCMEPRPKMMMVVMMTIMMGHECK